MGDQQQVYFSHSERLPPTRHLKLNLNRCVWDEVRLTWTVEGKDTWISWPSAENSELCLRSGSHWKHRPCLCWMYVLTFNKYTTVVKSGRWFSVSGSDRNITGTQSAVCAMCWQDHNSHHARGDGRLCRWVEPVKNCGCLAPTRLVTTHKLKLQYLIFFIIYKLFEQR